MSEAHEVIRKTVRLGTAPDMGTVYVEVEFSKDGRLSISGTHRNGGGQCDESIREVLNAGALTLAPGITGGSASRLLDVWQRWHLNHLQAGCEHQRAEKWREGPQIELKSYSMDWDAHYALERALNPPELKPGTDTSAIRERAEKQVGAARLLGVLQVAKIKPFEWVKVSGGAMEALRQAFAIIGEHDSQAKAKWEKEKKACDTGERRFLKPPRPIVLERTEHQHPAHTYEKDHPRGILCKPCPTCGHKYGSAWLREEVPTDVLEFLRGFSGVETAIGEPANPYDLAASDAMTAAGVMLTCKEGGDKRAPWTKKDAPRGKHWRVTMKGAGGSYTFSFWNSLNAGTAEPSAYSVIAGLEWYTPDSFEHFCSEYGYDVDSREAERTHRACLEMRDELTRIIPDEEGHAALAAIR